LLTNQSLKLHTATLLLLVWAVWITSGEPAVAGLQLSYKQSLLRKRGALLFV